VYSDGVTDVSKAPGKIAGMFDAIAARYDFLNHFLSAGIDRRWRKQAIRSLKLTGRERVLDLCAGTADVAITARTARPPARIIIGIDFAGAMLRVGQAKLRRRRLDDSIVLVRGDASRIPLASASVDAVTIAFGIRNVEDPRAACREIQRVLTAGGRLAILEFSMPTVPVIRGAYLWYFQNVLPRIGRAISRHDDAYAYLPASVGVFASRVEFTALLKECGFVDVSARDLTFGTVALYTARKAQPLAPSL
jgi:demethylmenaquinone methyltransferase/2-methoxy-6-polyprenyl-1,4-benzoquinol methylase